MKRQRGFTLIEALIGMVVGALVMAGGFRLWKTNQEESHRLQKKAELRDRMALSSKLIQRSITLAGLGMENAPTLVRMDAVGSDTLVIYTNEEERRTRITSSIPIGTFMVFVENASLFQGARFLALSDTSKGEVRAISRITGGAIVLSEPVENPYALGLTAAIPARRVTYFTDQEESRLIRMADGSASVLGRDLRNFQVSFRDRDGASTSDLDKVRAVQFSFTGVFPAREGALNSMLFTSTAIPRNIL